MTWNGFTFEPDTEWRVVMYRLDDPDYVLEVVSPTDYATAREYARALAEVLGVEMVVERVEAF